MIGGGSGGLACSKDGTRDGLDWKVIVERLISPVLSFLHTAASFGKKVAVLDYVVPSPNGELLDSV